MQVGPILSGDGLSPELCEERPIPKSLTLKVSDRFVKTSEEQSASHLFSSLIQAVPSQSATGSFWTYFQSQNNNPWPQRFLQAATTVSPDPSLPDYEKMIQLAERDCRFAERLSGRVEIPWTSCISPQGPREEKELAEWAQKQMIQIERDPDREGFTHCDFSQKLELARRIFEAMMRPEEHGGLGLQFDFGGEAPERNLSGILRDRQAACSEFVLLFLKVADLVGIPAVPIELFRNRELDLTEHLRIGIKNPKTGEIEVMVDLLHGFFGKPIKAEVWSEISRLQLLAYYYNLKGAQEPDSPEAENHIDFALKLFPENYVILLNKAYFLAKKGDLQNAKLLLLRSIDDYPFYSRAYQNLSVVAEKLKENPLARWARGKFCALNSDGVICWVD